ncbi:T9SS type A sorting domain-containing protein [Formosa sp. L2A11]|uniref:T9SS type A sorting domain-containing protein n=1 Tax=Formosa sp. L2A11 TaxID=2686363 RepID=UPI00131D3470|nr:T9SS type A sorting domain-containing protein [Formosa sp. L2A11]
MKKIYYLILFLFAISFTSFGQTILRTQSFEDSGTWGYTANPSSAYSGTTWDNLTVLGTLVPTVGTHFRGYNNPTNNSSSIAHKLTFDSVDVSTNTDVKMSFDYFYEVTSATDVMPELSYYIYEDGISTGKVVISTPGSSGSGTITIDVNDSASSAYLEIDIINLSIGSVGNTSSTANIGLDNFQLYTTAIFTGLIYDEINYGGWKDGNEPDNNTNSDDVLILNGSYTFTGRSNLKDLTISDDANAIINYNGRMRVLGNLTSSNNLTITSKSDSYGSLIVNGTATGLVTYERFTMMDGVNDLVSAPLSGITFGEFASATGVNNDSLYFSENDINLKKFGPFVKTAGIGGTYANWHAGNDSDEILVSGVGYRASTVSGNLLSYTGNVVTEDVETDVYYNINTLASQWNLVGNPFTSYFTMTPFLSVNQNLFQEDKVAVYAYNGIDWTIYNNNNAVNIAPGQGFYVAVKENIAKLGKLEFRESWRRVVNSDDFIAGRTETNYFLDIALNADDEEKHSNQLYFNEYGTNNLDKGYDSSIYGLNESGYTLFTQLVEGNTNYKLAIQTLSQDEISDGEASVQLGVIAPEGKKISISIKETNLDSTVKVYLEDTKTDEWTLLNDSPYTFVTNESLNGLGRFVLHISNEKTLGIEDESQEYQLQIYSGEHSIKLKGQLNKNTNLSVFDIQGRQIYYSTINQTVNEYTINTVNLSSGIYIVRIDNNGNKISKRVILK